MTASLAKSCRINSSTSRCAQRFANGKRCRLSARPGSNFCPAHATTHETEDLAATLTTGLDEFTSAAPINQFLSRLLLLLAQDRISPRRGAVMAYTANLILRSVSVMGHQAGKEPVHIEYVIGIPRPDYGENTTDAESPSALA
jgi:hypothetical protein